MEGDLFSPPEGKAIPREHLLAPLFFERVSHETLTMPAATGTQNGNGISISILNLIIEIVFENIFCIIMMNAAAPDGTPPRRFRNLPLFKPFAQRGPDEAAERPQTGMG